MATIALVIRVCPWQAANRRGTMDVWPRRTYAIDPQQAEWVRQIFTWFVQERRSLSWITRELNRLGAPKDHRAKRANCGTTNTSANFCVIKSMWGIGPGKMQNVRDPSSGKVTQTH